MVWLDSEEMSIETKAVEIIFKGLATLDLETKNFIYFKVKDYDVTYNKRKGDWFCAAIQSLDSYEKRVCRDVKSGVSIHNRWGCVFNKGKPCSHILAAKKILL